jgi:hypothetical protein
VPIVLKSGSLNLLEPSGPVKGCNGIALPLFLVHDAWSDYQYDTETMFDKPKYLQADTASSNEFK